MPERATEVSSLDWALARVGDRWTLLVVRALLGGPLRFGELAQAVTGVAPNILTKRLRSLEADGILHTERYQDRPPRSHYQLTEAGRELGEALGVLAAWGARHGGRDDTPYHPVCGTPLVSRPWCPTCDRPAEDDELVWL